MSTHVVANEEDVLRLVRAKIDGKQVVRTLDDLAISADVCRQHLTRIVNGTTKRINSGTFEALMYAMGYSVLYSLTPTLSESYDRLDTLIQQLAIKINSGLVYKIAKNVDPENHFYIELQYTPSLPRRNYTSINGRTLV